MMILRTSLNGSRELHVETLEIISWMLRAIAFVMLAFFVMPKIWQEFKATENGLKIDRWALMIGLNGVLLWILIRPMIELGWIDLQWAGILSGFGTFFFVMSFWVIVYRFQIWKWFR